MAGQTNKGGGAKKYGRNEKKCARYRAEGRRAKNRRLKDKRIARRYRRLSNLAAKRGDLLADSVLANLALRFEKRAG